MFSFSRNTHILVVIVALSFLADLSFYNISECFLLRINNTEDLLFNLFTVQATVTAMGIAKDLEKNRYFLLS